MSLAAAIHEAAAKATPAAAGVSPPWAALAVLVIVIGVSSAVYTVLVWRSTTHRRWVALWEWAREAGFRFHPLAQAAVAPRPPAPLDALRNARVRVEVLLTRDRITLVQVRTDAPAVPAAAVAAARGSNRPGGGAAATPAATDRPGAPATGPAAPGGFPVTPVGPPRVEWRLLIRQLETTWYPTGARPVAARRPSLLDLYSLSSFPLLGNAERFVIYGTDSAAARALGRSSARALLPPDVGLLLHGRYLVLDFSDRPFDAVEFNRMLAVADQVVAHLPVAA